MQKTIFIVGLSLILSLFSYNANAQKPADLSEKVPSGSKSAVTGTIKGRVFEKEQKVPMEYTNVVLYRQSDSTLTDGQMTDNAGYFVFKRVKPGTYYLSIHFIGFETKYVNNIKLRKGSVVNLGTAYLTSAATTLSNVEIKGEQRHVEYKLDKKIINVTKDLMASAGSAVEILENVPSVDVDLEGNVTLRGSSNFTVLINGRPSILDGNDALQELPASAIERIEIITNPSAKYDPDGVGGILNIVLKKNKKPGLNGIVNLSVGTNNKYRGDVQLSYRTGKVNFYGGVNGNMRDFNMKVHLDDQTFFTDTTNFRITDINGTHKRKGYSFKGGMDYYVTDLSTLTLSGKYGIYGFEMDNVSKRHIYTQPAISDEFSKSVSSLNRQGKYSQETLNFEHKFDDFGQKLNVMVNHNNRSGEDTEDQSNYFTDSYWNELGGTPSKINTTQNDTSSDWRIQADYSKPLGEKGMLEAGYQSRLSHQSGDFVFQNYDTIQGGWTNNSDYSNTIDFSRDIQGAYVTYSNTLGSFGFQAGLRGEHTYRNVQNKDTAATFVINRFDYFPSIHLSYQFKENLQLYTSYSRRIKRPRERELDPFPMVMDPYNMRVGNPELEPEYIDSYELGVQKMLAKSCLSLEAYYRVNKNKITRIKSVIENGVMIHTYQNLNKDFSLGVELMANINVAKWFVLNSTFNFYNYRLIGNINDEAVASNSNNWSAKLNANFKLKNNFKIQWSGIYRSPTTTAQGSRKGFAYTNLAIRKDFFKRRLSATLSARDLLGTAKYESTSRSQFFYSHSTFKRESPIISLSVSYLINNYKKKRTPQNSDTMDSMDDGF